MKRIILFLSLSMLMTACGEVSEKTRVTRLLKREIGRELPFQEVRIARVEGGTAVVVDKCFCYWIDRNDHVYCVNGNAAAVYRKRGCDCMSAPIEAMFMDIEKIAE